MYVFIDLVCVYLKFHPLGVFYLDILGNMGMSLNQDLIGLSSYGSLTPCSKPNPYDWNFVIL